jgi:iron complex outermembrane recepter protein
MMFSVVRMSGLALLGASVVAQGELLELEPIEILADRPQIWESELDSSTLRKPAVDMGARIAEEPGVDAIRMGGRGLDPVIRGQSQNRINVLLDGAYVFNGCPNRMDPPTSYAAMGSYDRVTVIRGVHTLRYGPGGSGGTVLMERDRPVMGQSPLVSGNLYARYQHNAHGRLFGANVQSVGPEAYLRTFAESGEAGNYRDGDGNRVLSAYQSRQGGVMAGWHINARSSLELGYEQAAERDVLYAGAGMDTPESDSRTLSLRGRYDLGDQWQMRAELHYNQVEHLMDNFSLRPAPMMPMSVPSASDTLSGRLEAESALGRGTLLLGGNYIDNQRTATMYNAAGNELAFMWPDITIRQVGVFAETRQPVTSRSQISGGVRIDHAAARVARAEELPNAGMPWIKTPAALYAEAYGFDGDLNRDDTLAGAFLRYQFEPVDGVSWFASASRAERVADATERYFARSVSGGNIQWVGNPGIDQEVHHQLDLGVQRYGQGFDYQLTLFANRISDYIYREKFVDGPLERDQYRNVSAHIYGAEAELGLQYAQRHETRLQLDIRRGKNRSDNVSLAQISPLKGTLAQHYERADWQAVAVMRFAARQSRLNEDAGERETAGYAVFDVRMGREIGPLTLSAGVDNLFDTQYADFINRNRAASDPLATADLVGEPLTEPGRSVWAGFDYRF